MIQRPWQKWPLRGIALAAAIGGTVLAFDSLYMIAKAELGQVLLQRAWENGSSAPWPGADIHPIARLTVPSSGKQVFVLDGATGKAMAWGPGHVQGTARPGKSGLSAIGGHRDSHMAFLADLGPGSELELATSGSSQTYVVSHAEVVDSRTWRYPASTDGPARLALTTCWPLNARTEGPMRLVVYAAASPS